MSSPQERETEWSGRHSGKDAVRAEIWARMQQQQVAVRDPVGHIPNFLGADLAAAQLAALSIWQQAQVIKCNPDAPQAPVRLRALQDGKRLYMAVPRLARRRCFVELTATDLEQRQIPLAVAATMRQALIHGRLVSFEEMQPIDLVVVGCVAAASDGGRTGKGAGFADLELAMLREFGLVQPETPIVTTVHELQHVANQRLPMQSHDWPLDWIVTPAGAVATHTRYPRPCGLDWTALRPEQIQTIPILRQLQQPENRHL